MIVYFGEPWDAPVLEGPAQRVPTPLGTCSFCDEAIEPDDRGFVRPMVAAAGDAVRLLPIHRECDLRSVLGGLDHVLGRCEYAGHCNELMEAAGRSLREDALAVWAWANGDRHEQ